MTKLQILIESDLMDGDVVVPFARMQEAAEHCLEIVKFMLPIKGATWRVGAVSNDGGSGGGGSGERAKQEGQ